MLSINLEHHVLQAKAIRYDEIDFRVIPQTFLHSQLLLTHGLTLKVISAFVSFSFLI